MQGYLCANYYEHGDLLSIKGYKKLSLNISKRGEIKGFSRKSRQRLMRLIATIDTSKVIGRPVFLTLTYPKEYSESYKDWKRDINVFFKRLYRYNPHLSAIWKLEFQKRGAPHFHLMIFNTDPARIYINHKVFSNICAVYWYEVVNSRDYNHYKAGINYQPIETYKAVRSYVSKYIAKTSASLDDDDIILKVGRFFGTHNKDALPISQVEVELTEEEFLLLRRIARNYLEKKIKKSIPIYARTSGISVFLDFVTAKKLIYFVKDLE